MTHFINEQPRESKDPTSDGSLDVVDVWKTIQGEGPYAGTPAVFVRLAGCNLDCPACDTDYTSNRKRMSFGDLIAKVGDLCCLMKPVWLTATHQARCLVVLTGGEPLRQNLGPFIRGLHMNDCAVQIETNGTFFDENLPWDRITTICSPKTSNIHPKLSPMLDGIKYVVEAGYIDERGLPTRILGKEMKAPFFANVPVYIQPLDTGNVEDNKRNTEAAVQVCMRFGFNLCLQIHKIVGLK